MTVVESVNTQSGVVVLDAENVGAVATTELGQPEGVATLNESGALTSAQLPSSVVSSSLAALGEVSGATNLDFSAGTFQTATLKGATTFAVKNAPSRPALLELLVNVGTGGYTFAIEGITWIGSEPTFSTTAGTRYLVTLLLVNGEVLGIVGLQGATGANGNTIRSGEGAPAEGLGVSGDFYIDTTAHKLYGPKVGTAWGAGTNLVGEKGGTGSKGETGETGPSSIESILGLCLPLAYGPQVKIGTASEVIAVAKKARFMLFVIPKATTKLKIWVKNGTVVKGNTRVGVYDTGQAAANEYTPLVQVEAAQAGASAWQLLELEHSFTAGQIVVIGVMNSTTEGTYALYASLPSALCAECPEGAFGSGTAVTIPKLLAVHEFAAMEFVKLTAAQMEASGAAPMAIIAHAV